MFEDDRAYYQHRAEIELARAQQAMQPEVVQVHYKLAEAYLDKLASGRSGGRVRGRVDQS